MHLLGGNYYPLFYLRSTSTKVAEEMLDVTQIGFQSILYGAIGGFTMDSVVKIYLVLLREGKVITLPSENSIGLWRMV